MKVVIEGSCDAAFAAVRDAFSSNFERDLELGAALSVSIEGRNVVDIWGGYLDEAQTRRWERDSLACIFSCTKGVVAVLALMLADRGLIDLDAPVAGLLARIRAERQGRDPGSMAPHSSSRSFGDRRADAVRIAERLGRHDRRARRAGTLVDAGRRSRLSRRHLRASRRRGDPAGHGLVVRYGDARTVVRATCARHPHAVARTRGVAYRRHGLGHAHRGPPVEDLLRSLAGRRPRPTVLSQPTRLQQRALHQHASVPRRRDPRRQRTRHGALARPSLRRAGVWRRARRRAVAVARRWSKKPVANG